jgi:lysophospholipase L1-like esterase
MRIFRVGWPGHGSGSRVVAIASVLLAAGAIWLATAGPWGNNSRPATASVPSADPPSASATTQLPSAATAAPAPATPATAVETVVALGDSVTAGSACDCTPFPERYAAALTARGPVAMRAVNLGESGLTTSGLVQQLDESSTQRALRTATIVIVTIGANDLVPLIAHNAAAGCDKACSQPAVHRLENGLGPVLHRVQAEDPDLQRLLVTTYWNVFEDGDVADALRGPGFAAWSDGVTREANAAICREAAAASATCVDLYTPFEGVDGRSNPTSLLADDGDHPNAAGHAVITAALLRATP